MSGLDTCLSGEIVNDFVQGRLPPDQIDGLAEHVDRCDKCRQSVARAATAGESRTEGVIGRYQLQGVLGHGGGGVVYRAFDPQLRRKIAIKLLNAAEASPDRAEARLLREAEAMAQLSHPNVVNVYDAGMFAEQVFVVMELVDGHTLASWLREKPRSVDEILRAFVEIGKGLQAAHDANIVHRDFKPQNTLIGSDGRIRVTDFGLARTFTDVDAVTMTDVGNHMDSPVRLTTLTVTRALAGTPAYMAPEQYLHQSIDARTDQFSFAVALHEAICGERPFAGDTIDDLRKAVVSGSARPFAPKSSVPSRLRELVARCLSVDPDRRYPSMNEVLADLSRVLEESRPVHRAATTKLWYAGAASLLVLSLIGVIRATTQQDAKAATSTVEVQPVAHAPNVTVIPAASPPPVVAAPIVRKTHAKASRVRAKHKRSAPKAKADDALKPYDEGR